MIGTIDDSSSSSSSTSSPSSSSYNNYSSHNTNNGGINLGAFNEASSLQLNVNNGANPNNNSNGSFLQHHQQLMQNHHHHNSHQNIHNNIQGQHFSYPNGSSLLGQQGIGGQFYPSEINNNQFDPNSRLSVCLKYATDPIQMAAAVAAAAAANNTGANGASSASSSCSGAPSSSSSSISMDDLTDGSSPPTHQGNGSQRHLQNLKTSYSPNQLVGFYNNNLLDSSYYKSSSNSNGLNSSLSSSSSSSSYGVGLLQSQNIKTEYTDQATAAAAAAVAAADYFAYSSFFNNANNCLNGHMSQNEIIASPNSSSYPINSSSPSSSSSSSSLIHNASTSLLLSNNSLLAGSNVNVANQSLFNGGSSPSSTILLGSSGVHTNAGQDMKTHQNLGHIGHHQQLLQGNFDGSLINGSMYNSNLTGYEPAGASVQTVPHGKFPKGQHQHLSNSRLQLSGASPASTASSSSSSSLTVPVSSTSHPHLHSHASSMNGNGGSGGHHHHHGLHGVNAVISSGSSAASSPHDAVPPNQLCAVCGDNAACQHYGVRTCEGCKGFFKRTVQKNSKYVCLAEKNCPVDKRRRNRCQYCRFQKCLAVGMVKEVVRTNDLKGRRGRLPTKPKSPNTQAVNSRLQPSAFLSQICRVFTDTIPNQASLDFSKYRKITKEAIRIDEEPFWIFQSLTRSCDTIRTWAEKFSSLCRISNAERDRMLYSNLLDLLIIRMALRMQENIERIVFCNANVFHKTQVTYVLTPTIMQQIQDLANKLKQPDSSISSLLVSLVFLQDPQQMQMNDIYLKIRELLKEVCQTSLPSNSGGANEDQQLTGRSYYYTYLTEILVQTRQIAVQLKQRLKQCNAYNSSMYPSCIVSNSMLDLFLKSPDMTNAVQQQVQHQQSQQQHVQLPTQTVNSLSCSNNQFLQLQHQQLQNHEVQLHEFS